MGCRLRAGRNDETGPAGVFWRVASPEIHGIEQDEDVVIGQFSAHKLVQEHALVNLGLDACAFRYFQDNTYHTAAATFGG